MCEGNIAILPVFMDKADPTFNDKARYEPTQKRYNSRPNLLCIFNDLLLA